MLHISIKRITLRHFLTIFYCKIACMVTPDTLLGWRRWKKSEETEGSERGDENSSMGVWQL